MTPLPGGPLDSLRALPVLLFPSAPPLPPRLRVNLPFPLASRHLPTSPEPVMFRSLATAVVASRHGRASRRANAGTADASRRLHPLRAPGPGLRRLPDSLRRHRHHHRAQRSTTTASASAPRRRCTASPTSTPGSRCSGNSSRARRHAAEAIRPRRPTVATSRWHSARPVPATGGARVRIDKTYVDTASYKVEPGGIVFTRSLGIARNSVVLPAGYELVAVNVPSQVNVESDGRIRVSFMNAERQSLTYTVRARALPAAAASSLVTAALHTAGPRHPACRRLVPPGASTAPTCAATGASGSGPSRTATSPTSSSSRSRTPSGCITTTPKADRVWTAT